MPAIVLVTFYSRNGATERLATAAAVGAVQARGNIRMRRLADPDPEDALARHPASAESLQRMWKEYVAPKEADVAAADAFVIGLPHDVKPTSPECTPFFELLARASAEGRARDKAAAVVGAGAAPAATAVVLRRMGFTLVEADPAIGDQMDRAVALGRQLVASTGSRTRT